MDQQWIARREFRRLGAVAIAESADERVGCAATDDFSALRDERIEAVGLIFVNGRDGARHECAGVGTDTYELVARGDVDRATDPSIRAQNGSREQDATATATATADRGRRWRLYAVGFRGGRCDD